MRPVFSFALAVLGVLTLAGCTPAVGEALPPEKLTTPPAAETPAASPKADGSDWGVTLAAGDITPTGLTLTCTQSGGSPTGRLQTGSYYSLEIWDGESWTAVEPLPQEYEIAWTEEAWNIPMEDSTQWVVNWEWLYGSLSAGTYRLGKELMDFRDTGDYDQQMSYAQFTIT